MVERFEHQLLRLHVLLGDDEEQLDEVFQAFQEADTAGRGTLKNIDDLASVLRKVLLPKDLKRVDIEALAARFGIDSGEFDYTAFCKALQKPPLLQPDSSQQDRRSPTKKQRGKPRSPNKLHRHIEGRMRIDQRLESQRLLMESVRHKLMHGIRGYEAEGFHGIQNVLHRLDSAGEGYLDEKIFMKQLIQRLHYRLTRPERDFLLHQLRVQSTEKGENALDYEQLGRICNVNSDDSLSEPDTEQEQVRPESPTKTSQLGADFLAAEKRLNQFLRTSLGDSGSIRKAGDSFPVPLQREDTPRSLVTGAERFLELAESVDQENAGLLHEDEFPLILSKCGVSIEPSLLSGMLSRFPRSAGRFLSYSAFLQRYGQNPQCARGRRELKTLVLNLLPRLTVPTAHWLHFLHQRFEKFDVRVHGTANNTLPTEAFMHAVQGRSSVLKLTADEAAQVTSLFLRASTISSPSRIYYPEFLRFVDECQQVARVNASSPPAKAILPASPTKAATDQNSTPSSFKPAEPPTSMSDDYFELSVCDYLMHRATIPERRNFEMLMEMLQAFQKDVNLQESDLQQVPNGIMMVLGEQLKVKVQFNLS